MAIKLALLQQGDQVISEMKELVDDGNPVWNLFSNPHRVSTTKQFFVEENTEDDKSIQVTLAPMVLLTSDKEL